MDLSTARSQFSMDTVGYNYYNTVDSVKEIKIILSRIRKMELPVLAVDVYVCC